MKTAPVQAAMPARAAPAAAVSVVPVPAQAALVRIPAIHREAAALAWVPAAVPAQAAWAAARIATPVPAAREAAGRAALRAAAAWAQTAATPLVTQVAA